MGLKYASAAVAGFNANPPPDDGSLIDANEITWAKHLDKLGQPVLTLAEAINSRLVTHFNVGPTTKSAAFTVSVNEHNQLIEVTGTTTISLPDATTLSAGFFTSIANAGAATVTVALVEATDTLDTVINGTISLAVGHAIIVYTNAAASGYITTSRQLSSVISDKSHWPTVANNGTDADHDIDFLGGTIADSTGAQNITFSTTITKQLDVDWAEGTNDGGIPTDISPVVASTTYHLFLIAKPDGTVDAGFDTSLTAANLLNGSNAGAAGYTLYRRIASFITDASSNWRPVTQNGDWFLHDTSLLDANHVLSGSTGATTTISNPTGLRLGHYLNWTVGEDGTASERIVDFGSTEFGTVTYAASSTALFDRVYHDASVGTNTDGNARLKLWWSNVNVFGRDADSNSYDFTLRNHGWLDPRIE